MQDERERAKAQGGYENDASNHDRVDPPVFRRLRGKTRYRVRDSFYLNGDIAVEVRCRRPLLASTPAAWNTEFDNACASLVASLKHRSDSSRRCTPGSRAFPSTGTRSLLRRHHQPAAVT